MGAARIFYTSAWQQAGSEFTIPGWWEPDPLWGTEACLAVFQVFLTGRGRIFSKEDVEEVANASGICGFWP